MSDNQANLPTNPTEDPIFSAAQQEWIYSALNRLISSGAAAFFMDACVIMNSKHRLQATTHLVSHCLREIEAQIRQVLLGITKQFPHLVIGVETNLEDVFLPYKSDIRDILSNVTISPEQWKKFDERSQEFINKTNAHKLSVNNCLIVLTIPKEDYLSKLWRKFPGKLASHAHRKALSVRQIDVEFNQLWIDSQNLFYGILKTLEKNYLAIFNVLNVLASIKSPTSADVKSLLNQTSNGTIAFQFFFNTAEVTWLPILEKNLFKNPPLSVNDDWPESRFLVRCASVYPEIVLRLVLALPATQNPYVLDDICDIAINLPTHLSNQLFSKLEVAIISPSQRLLPYKIGRIIEKFCSDGHVDEALQLFEKSLFIKCVPSSNSYTHHEFETRYPDYIYNNILGNYSRLLATKAPLDTISVLTKILAGIAQKDDFRFPALNADGNDQPEEYLISQLREICFQIIQRNNDTLTEIVKILDTYPQLIFKRIKEYLIQDPLLPYIDPIQTTVFWGDSSPKTQEQLALMTISELVEYLQKWTSPNDEWGISKRGLASTISSLVASDPETYADEAVGFKSVDPIYINALLNGLKKALEEQKRFNFAPVFDLCDFTLQSINEHSSEDDLWSLTEITWLLREGFISDGLLYEFREQTWQLLQSTFELSRTYIDIPTLIDDSPYLQSLNMFPGKSLDALMQYMLWIHRNLQKTKSVSASFENIPEVQKILELCLADASLPTLSVYGRYAPWLVLVDIKWFAKYQSIIFPEDEIKWIGVWNGYMHCPPFDRMLSVLKIQYERAIHLICTQVSIDSIQENTIRHLVMFYMRGLLNLDDVDGLLSKFYQVASPSCQGEVVRLIGHLIEDSEQIPPTEVLDWVKNLWLWRFEIAKLAPKAHELELLGFSWWFTSAKFQPAWLLEQLEKILTLLDKQPPLAEDIVKQLATFSIEFPDQSMKCLNRLIELPRNSWDIAMWEDDLKLIFSQIKVSQSQSAYEMARGLINQLTSYGFRQFQEYL